MNKYFKNIIFCINYRNIILIFAIVTVLLPGVAELFGKDKEQHYFEEAIRLFDAGNYNDAIVKFKQALKRDGKNAKIFISLGDAYYKLNQMENAQSSFEAALQINSELLYPHIRIALIKVLTGNCANAITDLENLRSKAVDKKDKANIYRGLARCYEATDKRKAIHAMDDLIKTDNDSMGFQEYLVLVRLYLDMGQSRNALSAIKKVLELKESIENRELYANILSINGKFEAAINEYKNLLKIKPNSADYHYHISEALFLNKDYEQGLKESSASITIAPKNAQYYLHKAKIQFNKEEYQDSIASARSAMEYGNNDDIKAAAQLLIGDCLYNQGKVEEALREYEELLNKYPNSGKAKITDAMVDSIRKNKDGKIIILNSIPVFVRLGENHALSACLKMYLAGLEIDLSDSEINAITFDDRPESISDAWLLLKAKDIDVIQLPSDINYIKTQIGLGVPLIMKINVKNSTHFVIIKGYDEKKQIFNVIDPLYNNVIEYFSYSEWQVVDDSILFVIPTSMFQDGIEEETNEHRKIALEKIMLIRGLKNYQLIANEPDGVVVAENILKLYPHLLEAKLIIALNHLNNRNYDKAIQYYKEILSISSETSSTKFVVYFLLGEAYSKLGEITEANKYFLKAEEMNPQLFHEFQKNYRKELRKELGRFY